MWSIIITRLLREPDRARVAIPEARWQELAQWSEEERPWEEALKRSAEDAGDEEEVRERLESAVLDLLRQAAFDRLLPQITHWSGEEKRLLYQLADEEGTRMGVDDDRYL